MLKPPTYDIANSNIALLGSDLEKKVKLAAAQTEPAWQNAGKEVGLKIWRIEKFHVKSWDPKDYGNFFSGDSYIVLHTYKKKEGDALAWDVHFWLGAHTTQDEAGTAAYKTVELDDVLGGAPVQHREVQDHESELFLSYFPGGVKILAGGVETGFHHVEPEKYEPRLLHLKGKKHIRVTQVPMGLKSLNSGDVFLLDMGLKLIQFNGKKSGPMERNKGAQLCRALDDNRGGKAEVVVIEEGDKNADFWKAVGGPGDIAAAGGDDAEVEKATATNKRLYRLSDKSGSLSFSEEASGKVPRSKLDSSDVFIYDVGPEVFVWIGAKASTGERKTGLHYAQDYLAKNSRPLWLPISRILEGGANEVFNSYLD
jgi:gelsolin